MICYFSALFEGNNCIFTINVVNTEHLIVKLGVISKCELRHVFPFLIPVHWKQKLHFSVSSKYRVRHSRAACRSAEAASSLLKTRAPRWTRAPPSHTAQEVCTTRRGDVFIRMLPSGSAVVNSAFQWHNGGKSSEQTQLKHWVTFRNRTELLQDAQFLMSRHLDSEVFS